MYRSIASLGFGRRTVTTRLFGLLALVSFTTGWLGEPFNFSGCEHHHAVHAAPQADAHAGHHHDDGHGHGHSDDHAASVDHDAGDESDHESEHGPCTCLGNCAGGGTPGVVSTATVSVVALDNAGPPFASASQTTVLVSGPRPHQQPWPTAPPRA